MKLASVGSAAFAASLKTFLTGSAPEMAGAQTITCSESTGACSDGSAGTPIQGGVVIELTEPGGAGLKIASDGEITFDPFGFGADTSDGVILIAAAGQTWTPNNFNGAFDTGFWTPIDGQYPAGSPLYPNTWVLPASIPGCGAENEPSCEPIAVWNYSAPLLPLTLILQEADGSYSDGILIRNTGPNGDAILAFASDPAVLIPEPSTWAMMLIGFVGLGYLVERAKKRRQAIPA
jgi:PEP-CTERM motif